MSSSLHTVRIRKQHFIACQRAHARLRPLYQHWQYINQALSYVDETRNQLFSQRFQALNTCIKQEGISLSPNEMDILQRRIEKFTQDIQDEIFLLEAELLEKQAEKARKHHHRSKNMTFLAGILKEKLPVNHPLNTALFQSLQNEKDPQSALLYQALELAAKEQSHLTKEQSALLSSLLAEQGVDLQRDWQAPTTPDLKMAIQFGQIETMIIKLGILDSQRDLSSYQAQYQTVLSLKDEVQRQLRADSLIFELTTQIRQEQHLRNLRTQLAIAIAELECLDDKEAITIAREADSMSQQGSFSEVTARLELVNDAIIRTEQRIIAAERRNVVLEGLRELGYQVNENTVNAWLTDGQVVISHPSMPDYGLELGAGGEESARFQVRTVAFSEERDTSRDRDIDAIWCHQHHQLQENLAKSGAELTIDRALPPGSGKMKVRERVDAVRQQRVVSHNISK
ncbi:hypothetical protein Xvie_02038 [Xenorhabdus vietnamensis]|uniref:Uncharacterized protein n=1 Tax=Xenorhabdus vietnamensis TaxID=351656 RepID=A0A1Y2SFC6_9GAMM|nr:hypothetical protein [Xenorhabdus vietnamensis]OTA16268.1 hypothetical protein Xvie_02038 [Xenorhabdus vietnamensis]